MTIPRLGVVALLIGLVGYPAVSGAQDSPVGVDQQVLARINGSDGAAVRVLLGTSDRTAYPVFYGALPLAWGPVLLDDRDREGALRLSASMVGTYVAVVGLKHLVRRPRPSDRLAWINVRSRYPGARDLDTWSWPSGHAALSAAIAASVLLDGKAGLLAIPAVAWSGLVGTSRIWLGVHYPGDVLSGWALGAGMAYLVHRVRNSRESGTLESTPLFAVSIPLG